MHRKRLEPQRLHIGTATEHLGCAPSRSHTPRHGLDETVLRFAAKHCGTCPCQCRNPRDLERRGMLCINPAGGEQNRRGEARCGSCVFEAARPLSETDSGIADGRGGTLPPDFTGGQRNCGRPLLAVRALKHGGSRAQAEVSGKMPPEPGRRTKSPGGNRCGSSCGASASPMATRAANSPRAGPLTTPYPLSPQAM